MLKIYGEIFESEEMKAVAEDIRTSPGDVDLVINSPGGEVIVALDIVNAIQHCEHNVVGTVESFAASAAGVIALACDKVKCDKNCIVMLHNCWTVAIGNKADLQNEINAMETIDAVMQSICSAHCKQPDKLKEMMDAGDVWLTGEELAEMFDNVELVEIPHPKSGENKKVALGGLGTYIATLRAKCIENENKMTELTAKIEEMSKKPEYQIEPELKALLEVKL